MAPQYGTSAFVILIICSNLAVLMILKSSGQASCGNSIPIAIGTPTAQMLGRWCNLFENRTFKTEHYPIQLSILLLN